jgi:hypothetical protein
MLNSTQNNTPMDWDEALDTDGNQLIILDEGNYNFIVDSFERSFFNGSEKISPCNKAILHLKVETDRGIANVKTDLILNKVFIWKIAGFFRSIGQKKRGEALGSMDWSKVIGSTGRAHFKPRSYRGKDGRDYQINDVSYYIDKENGFKEISDDDLPFD